MKLRVAHSLFRCCTKNLPGEASKFAPNVTSVLFHGKKRKLMVFSRVQIPEEPNIVLGVNVNGETAIIATVPCRGDSHSQIIELQKFLCNLKVVGISGMDLKGFPKVECIGAEVFLFDESERVPITMKNFDVENAQISGISSRFWVDGRGKYHETSTVIDTGVRVLRGLLPCEPHSLSAVVVNGMRVGDMVSIPSPRLAHVVRLRWNDLILERRFEGEPSVTVLRRSFLKAFGSKLLRADVISGVSLNEANSAPENAEGAKPSPFSRPFVLVLPICIVVMGVIVAYLLH